MEEVKTKRKRNNVIKPRMVHDLSTHRWHMKRYGRCPYCKNGSKPVSRAELLKDL